MLNRIETIPETGLSAKDITAYIQYLDNITPELHDIENNLMRFIETSNSQDDTSQFLSYKLISGLIALGEAARTSGLLNDTIKLFPDGWIKEYSCYTTENGTYNFWRDIPKFIYLGTLTTALIYRASTDTGKKVIDKIQNGLSGCVFWELFKRSTVSVYPELTPIVPVIQTVIAVNTVIELLMSSPLQSQFKELVEDRFFLHAMLASLDISAKALTTGASFYSYSSHLTNIFYNSYNPEVPSALQKTLLNSTVIPGILLSYLSSCSNPLIRARNYSTQIFTDGGLSAQVIMSFIACLTELKPDLVKTDVLPWALISAAIFILFTSISIGTAYRKENAQQTGLPVEDVQNQEMYNVAIHIEREELLPKAITGLFGFFEKPNPIPEIESGATFNRSRQAPHLTQPEIINPPRIITWINVLVSEDDEEDSNPNFSMV